MHLLQLKMDLALIRKRGNIVLVGLFGGSVGVTFWFTFLLNQLQFKVHIQEIIMI